MPTLQTHYYLDHFHEMLDFVLARYDHVLGPEHRDFVDRFRDLSIDGQSLYVRFANRKGSLFSRDQLCYSEIDSIETALAELRECGFACDVTAGDFHELLTLQKREDLVTCIRARDLDYPRISSAKKGDLVAFAFERFRIDDVFSDDELGRYTLQSRLDAVEYLLFLYFGKLRHGLTSFALRDLGVIQTSKFTDKYETRFESREVALAAFHYARVLDEVEARDPRRLRDLSGEVSSWPIVDDFEIESQRHRSIHRLGRHLERQSESDLALSVYLHSDQYPATERTARLLVEKGDREGAETLLTRMIEEPSSDDELLFAEDFYRRKFEKQKVGRLTELLRSAETIPLDESNRDRPEAAAVAWFARQGVAASHVENRIWGQLFGLVFWDLFFGEAATGIHSSFDWKPSGLDSGAFYHRHEKEIEALLETIDDPGAAVTLIDSVWNEHAGTPNGLCPWYEDLFALVRELVRLSPSGAISPILREMMRDHKNARSGFPDLLLIENDTIRFAEIKAEGDQLRRNQLRQIERLSRAGFPVEVIRVAWTVDPAQEYVVVDIETTGGKAEWNRVTEIGAVKVVGNEIVEEWSTLVNPERGIPQKIVTLTGITDEMVATAPKFPEIADAFREFVGDAVFVAHSAKFDYGFLREEYRRIEENFRCPTLCTVVAMRRFFPGLPSYGLGNLCKEFEVSLESHHRALCDAKATAELLLKINAKRIVTNGGS